MRFQALESFVGIEERIVVFEADNEADRYAVFVEPVDPAAAVGVGIEWPAHRVGDPAGANVALGHLPEFLDADGVDLGIDAVELVALDEGFGERAAGALGEDGDFGAEFVAGSEIRFGLAALVEALVLGDDAGDAVVFEDQLRAGELREQVYAGLFDQAAQPFRDAAERDNIVAVVAERGRRDREFHRALFGEEIGGIVGDGGA